jgi:hypothetical protein
VSLFFGKNFAVHLTKVAMKNIIFFIVVIMLFVIGCKTKSDVTTTGSKPLSNLDIDHKDVNSPFRVDDGLELNDTLFASIEKGVCFGNCSAYKMHIYCEGFVALTALRGNKMNGLFRSRVTPDQMNLLLEKAKEIKFGEMKSVYDNKSVTDLPMVKTSIVLSGKHKKVKRRYEYPREILELEKMFDNLLDELEWEKIKGVMLNY